ncbi:MAG TPA: hypothetical protein VEA37_09655 [Flavobacterium sp.]|nr:hypothetical protein [Flavobacterium sp.]
MGKNVTYKGSLNGTAPIYRPFPVNDSQTIKAGDIVVLATNKASIAADAAAAGTVLGIASNAITTTTATATDLVYVDINPASIYEMPYIGTGTVAIGNSYDMGAAAYQFDADDTTGGYIKVVGNIDTTAKKADVILGNRVF